MSKSELGIKITLKEYKRNMRRAYEAGIQHQKDESNTWGVPASVTVEFNKWWKDNQFK